MKKVVFISKNTNTGNLMRKALTDNGFKIIEPNLNKMSYYSDGSGKTIIKSDGVDISDASHMIMRTTKEISCELYRLALTLESNGCVVVDGVERLKRTAGDKSTSSIERVFYGGIPTFVPYDKSEPPVQYPLIVKPINGKYCKGVRVCNNYDEYTKAYDENGGDVIVQKYIKFEHECRVLVVNLPYKMPRIIYVASKRNVARKGTKRKATFVPWEVEQKMYSTIHMNPYCIQRKGIIGYDIGLDSDGNTHIVEANYSPRFDRATKKLGEDIADKIVKTLA